MPRLPHPLAAGLAALFVLGLSACGSDDPAAPDGSPTSSSAPSGVADPTAPSEPSGGIDAVPTDAEALESLQEELESALPEMADSLEAQQTGGSASLTIGDETWEFDGVLCAFGEDEIGQEGAEFVLSAIADGLQFYLSIDSYGHYASLDDIENFDDPALSWQADSSSSGEFIEVDGTATRGEAAFVDFTDDSMEEVQGSFEGSCP